MFLAFRRLGDALKAFNFKHKLLQLLQGHRQLHEEAASADKPAQRRSIRQSVEAPRITETLQFAHVDTSRAEILARAGF